VRVASDCGRSSSSATSLLRRRTLELPKLPYHSIRTCRGRAASQRYEYARAYPALCACVYTMILSLTSSVNIAASHHCCLPLQAMTFRELFANSAMRPYLVRRARSLQQGPPSQVRRR